GDLPRACIFTGDVWLRVWTGWQQHRRKTCFLVPCALLPRIPRTSPGSAYKNPEGKMNFMTWIRRVYSKKHINKVGKLIRTEDGTPTDLKDAREKVGNVLSEHAYPLFSVTIPVRKHDLVVNQNATTARRLKRLPTIIDKAERHPNMS